MMDVTVAVLGLSGIIMDAPKKKSNNKFKDSISLSSSGSTFDSVDGGEPITSVITFFKNVSSSHTAIASHLPSIPLRNTKSKVSDTKYHFMATWPTDFDPMGNELSTFKCTRMMKKEYVPNDPHDYSYDNNRDRPVFCSERIPLTIGLMKGTEIITVGSAAIVLTGEERDEVQVNLPVSLNKQEMKESMQSGSSQKMKKKPSKKKRGTKLKPVSFPNDSKHKFCMEENSCLRLLVKVTPAETTSNANVRNRSLSRAPPVPEQVQHTIYAGSKTIYGNNQTFDYPMSSSSSHGGSSFGGRTQSASNITMGRAMSREAMIQERRHANYDARQVSSGSSEGLSGNMARSLSRNPHAKKKKKKSKVDKKRSTSVPAPVGMFDNREMYHQDVEPRRMTKAQKYGQSPPPPTANHHNNYHSPPRNPHATHQHHNANNNYCDVTVNSNTYDADTVMVEEPQYTSMQSRLNPSKFFNCGQISMCDIMETKNSNVRNKHNGAQKQSNDDLGGLYLRPTPPQPQLVPPEYEDAHYSSSKSHSKDHVYCYDSASSDDDDQFRPQSSKSNMSLVDSYSDDEEDDEVGNAYHHGTSKHSNPTPVGNFNDAKATMKTYANRMGGGGRTQLV